MLYFLFSIGSKEIQLKHVVGSIYKVSAPKFQEVNIVKMNYWVCRMEGIENSNPVSVLNLSNEIHVISKGLMKHRRQSLTFKEN